MTSPSPKIIKALEGRVAYDEKHGWMNPEKTHMVGTGYVASLVRGFMDSKPDLYPLALAMLKERYGTSVVDPDMPELKFPWAYIQFVGDILDRHENT